MPIAHISILEGRADEQKEELIRQVTAAISDSLHAPRESVRVLIHELPKSHWGIGGVTAKKLGR